MKLSGVSFFLKTRIENFLKLNLVLELLLVLKSEALSVESHF